MELVSLLALVTQIESDLFIEVFLHPCASIVSEIGIVEYAVWYVEHRLA